MSAKISAVKRAAFLKALGATGNISISAARAKVSRSWVLLHRSRDPDFDAACGEALRRAEESLCGHPHPARPSDEPPSPACGRGAGNRPPSGWRFVGGEEMVVRGTRSGPRGSARRRVQIGRARLKQWTARGEARFLEALAHSCNVTAACAEVGLTPASAYNHRERWPGFARAWDAVIETAEVKLEVAQIECARNSLAGLKVPLDNPIREMTASEAIYMLEMFRRRREGHGRRWGRVRTKEPSIEEVRAKVLRKVEAVEKARRLSEEGEGKGRRG